VLSEVEVWLLSGDELWLLNFSTFRYIDRLSNLYAQRTMRSLSEVEVQSGVEITIIFTMK